MKKSWKTICDLLKNRADALRSGKRRRHCIQKSRSRGRNPFISRQNRAEGKSDETVTFLVGKPGTKSGEGQGKVWARNWDAVFSWKITRLYSRDHRKRLGNLLDSFQKKGASAKTASPTTSG